MSSFPSHALLNLCQRCCVAALACAMFVSLQASGQSVEIPGELQSLTSERQMLTNELQQYEKTLEILQTDSTPPEQSSNPAVQKLAQEMVNIKQRLIAITEREVTLLQEQIILAKTSASNATASNSAQASSDAIESKPLRTHGSDDTLAQEAENVKRLHGLLAGYYTELQESAHTLPTAEEIARREAAQQDAEKMAKIPFSADKVRLSGAEGSTALTLISQRLMDSSIPESRRDIAPICVIKTRLYGSLVGSETRSLTPVGKNHFVAKVRLQPGDTTLNILASQWELRLPHNVSASDFLITLYRPSGGTPELHIFSIDELLAEEKPYIPAWLPDDLKLKARAG